MSGKRTTLPIALILLLFVLSLNPVPSFAAGKTLSSSSVNETAGVVKEKVKTRKPDRVFIQSVADVSVDLLKETVAKDKKNNVLISPHSIVTALAVIENGAAGNTLKEVQKCFGGISVNEFSEYLSTMNRRLIRDSGVDYRIANSVWYRKNAITLRKAFLRKVAGYFGADVYSAPFNAETVADINKWVSNNTEEKIPSIIDKLSRNARVVVLNALYFNGKWAKPYQTEIKKTFTMASGKTVKVPMLEGTESEYVRINGGLGFLKYYKGGSVAFLGLLPPKGTSVEEYVKGLSGKAFIDAYKKRGTATVYTRMPKFSYSYSTSLEPVLKKLGVKSMFSPAADFSNMTDTDVFVDKILHKTFIRVDQEGTEAAAVTAILMDGSAVYDPDRVIKKVYLNRPFVYALIDTKTGIPLFLGCVKDPS